jgi:hypothetical protein
MSWWGCGRKRSWPNVKVLSQILSGRTEKNQENLSQDNQSQGWDLNSGRPEYKAGVLNHATTTFGFTCNWNSDTDAVSLNYGITKEIQRSCKLNFGNHSSNEAPGSKIQVKRLIKWTEIMRTKRRENQLLGLCYELLMFSIKTPLLNRCVFILALCHF